MRNAATRPEAGNLMISLVGGSVQSMTAVQYVATAVGALLVIGAFIYKGTYNGVFVHGRREPDYPPNLAIRVLFFVAGLAIIWAALTGRIN